MTTLMLLAVLMCGPAVPGTPAAAEPSTLKFTGGEADLQALLAKAPVGAVVVCEQTQPLIVAKTLRIARPMTLRGLRARLPEKLGDTVLLVVEAKGVTLVGLELHGNYDSVPQEKRAPLIHIKAGDFRVERCEFFDGTKDGIMVTPDEGAGDIVGGVIRRIEGTRMGRDVVSLSGGCGGQRVRNVTVENVRLKKSYFRGAVEVSDGTDHITVRHVRAEDAVYAIDVQDHGARQPGKTAPSAPNTNITLEDVAALNCRHVLRTANHPLGHSSLVLRDFVAKDCREPVLISNTTHVRVQNLTVINEPEVKKPRITLRNCEDVDLRNVTIIGLQEGTEAVTSRSSSSVKIEGLKRQRAEYPASRGRAAVTPSGGKAPTRAPREGHGSLGGAGGMKPTASARTFHVSVDQGDDANPGSPERPWKTIQKAAAAIWPGDTVVIHRGIYREYRFHLGPAGRGRESLTIYRSAPGERVLLAQGDGTPPGFGLDDYVRAEGLWIGGRWTQEEHQPICGVGGSPIGRGKQLVRCTIFGYTDGILVGSSQDLLIQGCRIVHCGRGRFSHGCYLSGGYTKGAMTQHVVLDDNAFVAGEGYAIHGWHNPHSCVVTRNFVSGFYWDLVLSGSDHLVAHNTLWRNTGQAGREPGFNAWLPAERVVFVNNALNSALPIFDRPGAGSHLSHNAYLSASPCPQDARATDLRKRDPEVEAWVRRIDAAVLRIDLAFGRPVEQIYEDAGLEKDFARLREPPPESSGLLGAGKDIGLLPQSGRTDVGRSVTQPEDFWATFDRLKLWHFDCRGQITSGPP